MNINEIGRGTTFIRNINERKEIIRVIYVINLDQEGTNIYAEVIRIGRGMMMYSCRDNINIARGEKIEYFSDESFDDLRDVVNNVMDMLCRKTNFPDEKP